MGRSGASYDLTWTTTAIKTTTYTAAPWELVRCDASAGSFTVTLPAANSAGQQVAVELLTTSGTFTVTVARAGSDTINAAGTSVTLTLTDEAVVLTSNGAGVWTIAQGRVTTASLDGRYVQPALTGAAAGTDMLTTQVTGDSVTRYVLNADGKLEWGSGSGAVDTNLYRGGAAMVKTDHTLSVLLGLQLTRTSALSAIQCFVSGDSVNRLRIDAAGKHEWGPGSSTAVDTNLYRSAAAVLATDHDFSIKTAGKGLQVKEGSNAKMGTAVLVAGSVVVSTTAVTANSRVFLTSQVDGGTPGWLRVSTRTAGTSFTVTSSSGSDTSTIAWLIMEPSA